VQQFVYGTRAHVPDLMVVGGSIYRLVTDALGSVRFVVDVSDGRIVQEVGYDAWGVVTSETIAAGFEAVPFGFAGGLYDPLTGLVRFGARDYDPEVGRWTAKDPIRFAGGDGNLYGYVGGDPVNWGDPSGLKVTIGGDSAFQNAVNAALNKIASSASGQLLLLKLEQAPALFEIYPPSGKGNCGLNHNQTGNFRNGSNIYWTPGETIMISGVNGEEFAADAIRILIHELAHILVGANESRVISEYENPISVELGYLPRVPPSSKKN